MPKNIMKHIISLGAGVQSSTMALMAAHGEITPMPDCAIFADTQAEPESVYKWLDWLEPKLPFPVHRVTKGDLAESGLVVKGRKKDGRKYQQNLIPLFIRKPDGKKGILGRKCTRDYKISPIVKLSRELVGYGEMLGWRSVFREELRAWTEYRNAEKLAKKEKRKCTVPFPYVEWEMMQGAALVESWIGISTDEATRMKPSQEPWIRTRWPLIDAKMSRLDCFQWMRNQDYPEPPRSACSFCPYHSDREWFRLKTEEPIEFEKAVDWELRCQDANRKDEVTVGVPYLHSSLVPLSEVPFEMWIHDERRQMNLFENECEGMCGV